MNDNNIAEKIARLRKEKGLTQSQLAEMINVSNKTISRWETGEGYPEISLLMPPAMHKVKRKRKVLRQAKPRKQTARAITPDRPKPSRASMETARQRSFLAGRRRCIAAINL